MAELPRLSERLLRLHRLGWEALVEKNGFTGDHLKWHESRERRRAASKPKFTLAAPPCLTLDHNSPSGRHVHYVGGEPVSFDERKQYQMDAWAARQNDPSVIDTIGIAESAILAKACLSGIVNDYLLLWAESKKNSDQFAEWLICIRNLVVRQVGGLWTGEWHTAWFERACSKKVAEILAPLIKEWTSRASALEMKHLENPHNSVASLLAGGGEVNVATTIEQAEQAIKRFQRHQALMAGSATAVKHEVRAGNRPAAGNKSSIAPATDLMRQAQAATSDASSIDPIERDAEANSPPGLNPGNRTRTTDEATADQPVVIRPEARQVKAEVPSRDAEPDPKSALANAANEIFQVGAQLRNEQYLKAKTPAIALADSRRDIDLLALTRCEIDRIRMDIEAWVDAWVGASERCGFPLANWADGVLADTANRLTNASVTGFATELASLFHDRGIPLSGEAFCEQTIRKGAESALERASSRLRDDVVRIARGHMQKALRGLKVTPAREVKPWAAEIIMQDFSSPLPQPLADNSKRVEPKRSELAAPAETGTPASMHKLVPADGSIHPSKGGAEWKADDELGDKVHDLLHDYIQRMAESGSNHRQLLAARV